MKPPSSHLVRLSARSHAALGRIRFLSQFLDNAVPVPGTTFRVGLDPFLGLIPGAGDVVSVLISVYIVLESLRFRLPKETLIRMVSNLLTDTALGSIPVAGDVFDVVWKANARNLQLLEAHLQNPDPSRAADRFFVLGVILVLALLVLVVVVLTLGSLRLLWWIFTGS
ncbi:MAG: DUF4112 domain-containing protein [Synechococcales cyanobacterium T60_A2020_003]|nr:DUF4112 domain-containing protein [Synechococcales cyanobacterium T60_A2020_003]